MSEIIIYQTTYNQAEIEARLDGEAIWTDERKAFDRFAMKCISRCPKWVAGSFFQPTPCIEISKKVRTLHGCKPLPKRRG